MTTYQACQIAADIYEHTVPTMLASMATGEGVSSSRHRRPSCVCVIISSLLPPTSVARTQKFEPCSKADLFDVEYWSLEQGSPMG